MRSLVTGGTGFIGRQLVALLIERHGPESVTCLVKRSTAPSAKPVEAAALERFRQAGVTILEGDLTDSPVCASPPPRVDAVFHLAANIDTDTPESEHRVNDRGTANLLEWLRPTLSGCRVMYTSSVAVIDRSGPADGPMREETICAPRTAYGVTKLRAEEILRAGASERGYAWTIVRLPTVYGPGGKAGGMFDLVMSSVRRGTWISRLNWPGRTSVLFIDDAAAIIHTLASRPDAEDELFMVSSGEDCTISDISRETAELVGRPVRPIRLPAAFWSVVRRLVWHPIVRRAVPRRAQVTYWRLSLIVDDGFWCDPSKLFGRYREPVVHLREGLGKTLAG